MFRGDSPLQTPHIHPLFPFLRFKYLLFSGRPVYFRECDFSAARASASLNSAASDSLVFSLAAGDGAPGSAGPLSRPLALAALPPLGKPAREHRTLRLFTAGKHSPDCSESAGHAWNSEPQFLSGGKKKWHFILRHRFSLSLVSSDKVSALRCTARCFS